MSLQARIDQLYISQQDNWQQYREAVDRFGNIKTKSFFWGDNLFVSVQFNESRICSSLAKVKKEDVERRPCFLCEDNRPKAQSGIPYKERFLILLNPYPILSKHLTIVSQSHVAQRIRKRIKDMMELAVELPDYVIFYNGPGCGASAPDHFHLQAGLKNPVLLTGQNLLRSCFVIESDKMDEAEELFEDVYKYLKIKQPDEVEPMMNIISFVENGKYVLHIFPRRQHRPRQYSLQGESQLLISPGALDMAGLIIAARDEDFEKITKEDIEDIYFQVSLSII